MKKFLLGLVIVLVIVVAGFVVYRSQSYVDSSDWKIYKNDKYGFEFKYPNNWFILPDPENKESVYFSKKYIADIESSQMRKEWIKNMFLIADFGNELRIGGKPGTELRTPEQYLDAYYPDKNIQKDRFDSGEREWENINGISVLKYKNFTGKISYIFFREGKAYLFILQDLPLGQDEGLGKDVYDPKDTVRVEKIISTIKFTK